MTSKPDIWVLSDWYVPGYKAGGPIRSLHNMVLALRDDANFHIITRNTDWHDPVPYDVPADTWLERDGARVQYLSGRYLRTILGLLRSSRADMIWLNGIYSPLFNAIPLLWLLVLGNRKARIVVSPRGMLNANAMQLKSAKKRLLIAAYKWTGITKKVVFHAASKEEVISIHRVFPSAQVELCENFPLSAAASPEQRNPSHRCRAICVGRISPVKNPLFLIERARVAPEVHIDFIGSADDADYESRCKERAAGTRQRLVGSRNPEELTEEYQKADYFISPTTGENFGHAIVEAMAYGLPVIISDRTPWSDVERSGAGFVIPLEEEGRWEQVLQTLPTISAETHRKMSEAALAYIRSKFDHRAIRAQYLNLIHGSD